MTFGTRVKRADLLVVGAGRGQLPAITSARASGLRVVVVDRDASAVGMAIADDAYAIDVTDVANVVEIARAHRIRGAMTLQSDLPIPAVGAVNDSLGLNGISSAVAHISSNKIAMRRRFATHGVPQPRFREAITPAQARSASDALGYPVIVKAPDSSGSRGVARVDAPEQVAHAFGLAHAVSRGASILVEECIVGTEFGAQTFSIGGRCVAVHLHDDEVSAPPHMVPICHTYPSSLSDRAVRRAEHVIASAVEALGIGDGPANVDAILGPDGDVWILEIGARIGATCLPELTTLHTGTDWVLAAIRAALGEAVDFGPHAGLPVSAWILEAPEDGTLRGWSVPPRVLQDERLVDWEVTARRGDVVSRLRAGPDRIGKVVATGPDNEAAARFARAARAGFRFEVDPTGSA